MRIAVLADIHGNLPALEAVIQKLDALEPEMVVVNGDLINGVPFNKAVLDRIMVADRQENWHIIRGNHEFYYLNFGTERAEPGSEDPERWGGLHWLIEQMTPEYGNYLGTLPDERTFYLPKTQPIQFSHGVPGNNRTGFQVEQAEEKVAEKIEHVAHPTLISAHTHVQIDRHIGLADGEERRNCHLINPGSVGLPLNENPDAQFAILESVPDDVTLGGWHCTHYSIPYDRRPVLEEYATSGMLEAGGVIGQLFYWEMVTQSYEIIFFYRWAYEQGLQADDDIMKTFRAYVADSGREQYVMERDPLGSSSLATYATRRSLYSVAGSR